MSPSRLILKIVQILVLSFIILYYPKSMNGKAQAEKIPIGAIFDQNIHGVQDGFKLAIQHYINHTRDHLDFDFAVDVINTADTFKLSKLICNQFGRRVIAIIGAVSSDSFEILHSYTNKFHIPFVTPWFPEMVLPTTSGLHDFALNMRPDYYKAVIETIIYYEWKSVIYVYDSHDGLLRMLQLYESLKPGKQQYNIESIKRVTNAEEVIDYLVSIEQHDPWRNKYVVLDSTTQLAKEALILHVRNVYLGRQNYHYLLSGLVMDDPWEKDIKEFGVVNVTGFGVLDHSRKIVRDFMNASGRDTLSAQAALMYDSVELLVNAIHHFLKRRPDTIHANMRRYINSNNSKIIECIPYGMIASYEHGEKIFKLIKKTKVEGLTGVVRFNGAGQRKDFSLQIIELTAECNKVKVATWNESTGFVPLVSKTSGPKTVGLYQRNITYIVTTVAEYPYIMSQNSVDPNTVRMEPYIGFCADLAKIVMDKLDLKYELRLVKDGKFGKENPTVVGGYDGILGELIRQEADLAIAPFIITTARENVIDFTQPYLSFYLKPTNIKNQTLSLFILLAPFSMEVWGGIGLSILFVGIVLLIVSLLSARMRQPSAQAATKMWNNKVNVLKFSNALWFVIAALLQQGNNLSPKSLPEKMVTIFWSCYRFLLVTLYTANMSSHLTIFHMGQPLPIYARITSCPEDSAHIFSFIDKALHFISFYHRIGIEQTCEMFIPVSSQGLTDFAIAVPKGSQLRTGMNKILIELKKNGELQSLVRKWVKEFHYGISEKGNGELTLRDVAGLFVFLICGMTSGLCVALIDYIYKKYFPQAAVRLTTVHLQQSSMEPGRQQNHDRSRMNEGAFAGFYGSSDQVNNEEIMELTTFSQL